MGLEKPFRMPTLDEIALNPALVNELSPEAAAFALRKATTVSALLSTCVGGAAPNRLLSAEEAAARMGRRVSWMKDAGRRLEFAVRVGREWRWSEAGVEKWIKQKERGR